VNDANEYHGIGDNAPPGPPLDDIDPTSLVAVKSSDIPELLHLNFAALEKERDLFLAGIKRWIAAHTVDGRQMPVIRDRDDCGDTLDYLGKIKSFTSDNGEVDRAKRPVKGPLDKASKAVQTWFVVGIADPVAAAMQTIQDAYSVFMIEDEERQRRANAQKARSAREEAERLTEQARRATDEKVQDVLLQGAADSEHEAEVLTGRANAPTVEVTRIRGRHGTVGGLKTTWRWREENLMDLVQAVASGQQPIQMLTVNEKFVDPLVKAQKGAMKIPGLHIFPEQKGR
jgi:hypothetical protein